MKKEHILFTISFVLNLALILLILGVGMDNYEYSKDNKNLNKEAKAYEITIDSLENQIYFKQGIIKVLNNIICDYENRREDCYID